MVPRQRYPQDIRRCLFYLFPISILILVAFCTGGYLITEDQLAHVKIGVSTQEDVRKVLGEPMSVSRPNESKSPPESWVYPLSKYASDPNTGVPPIGVVGVPISRGRRKTTEIEISFSEKGIVSIIEERRPPQ